MTLPEISLLLFTLCNGIRLVSYLPQITKVIRDKHGASAISYLTWSMWLAANASTALYAHVNLADLTMAFVNAVNAACCAAVIILTVCKRHTYRSRKRTALQHEADAVEEPDRGRSAATAVRRLHHSSPIASRCAA